MQQSVDSTNHLFLFYAFAKPHLQCFIHSCVHGMLAWYNRTAEDLTREQEKDKAALCLPCTRVMFHNLSLSGWPSFAIHRMTS